MTPKTGKFSQTTQTNLKILSKKLLVVRKSTLQKRRGTLLQALTFKN
jgi:hypothetical protein